MEDSSLISLARSAKVSEDKSFIDKSVVDKLVEVKKIGRLFALL